MAALPAHLEADMSNFYSKFRVEGKHAPIRNIDNMAGYPEPKLPIPSTWAASETDHADPVGALEHDDHVSVASFESGRRIIPPPPLDNPDGAPDLQPDLTQVESRPVSPLGPARPGKVVPPTPDPLDRATSRPGSPGLSDHGDPYTSDADVPAAPKGIVPGPLKIDQVAHDRNRDRIRRALQLVTDENSPLTVGSLTTLVDEISALDARINLMERQLSRDRASTRFLIGTTARSEAAASELRMQTEVAALRSQIDAWRAHVPAPPRPTQTPSPVGPPTATPPAAAPSRRGFRRG